MKKSLAHLPKRKHYELALVRDIILDKFPDVQMLILFGSYARGDWVDGPHIQGRGRLTIRKRSDYDIFVVTWFSFTAKDTALWGKVKAELEYLAKRVKLLQRLTKKICKVKIESFV